MDMKQEVDKDEIRKMAEQVTKLCNNLTCKYDVNELSCNVLAGLPKNGVYVIFDKTQRDFGLPRIVRVGTHIRKDNLTNRIKNHFLSEDKDSSIFRKNVGLALLEKDGSTDDLFKKQWKTDFKDANKRKYWIDPDFNYGFEYLEKKAPLEKRVTDYMKENLSFAVIEITGEDFEEIKKCCLKLEEKLIATLSLDNKLNQKLFPNWLGNFSPENKIKESGLWLVQKLYKKTFQSENELNILKGR